MEVISKFLSLSLWNCTFNLSVLLSVNLYANQLMLWGQSHHFYSHDCKGLSKVQSIVLFTLMEISQADEVGKYFWSPGKPVGDSPLRQTINMRCMLLASFIRWIFSSLRSALYILTCFPATQFVISMVLEVTVAKKNLILFKRWHYEVTLVLGKNTASLEISWAKRKWHSSAQVVFGILCEAPLVSSVGVMEGWL